MFIGEKTTTPFDFGICVKDVFSLTSSAVAYECIFYTGTKNLCDFVICASIYTRTRKILSVQCISLQEQGSL